MKPWMALCDVPDALYANEDARRAARETLELFEYGALPGAAPVNAVCLERDARWFGGKAARLRCEARGKVSENAFSIPFTAFVPASGAPRPAVLYMRFSAAVPSARLPVEDLLDAGFSVISFCYVDAASDDADFSGGVAGALTGEPRGAGAPGKLMLWAWSAMRVLDAVAALRVADASRVWICGHSRLGKAALVAAAFDERFYGVYANNSGCSGAAIHRAAPPEAENIERITNRFPYWFCPAFAAFAGRANELPFDQNALFALIAPRGLYIASAMDDRWAGPDAEYLGFVLANRLYERVGVRGVPCPDRPPRVGDVFHGARAGYHMRAGGHDLTPEDWALFARFANHMMAEGL